MNTEAAECHKSKRQLLELLEQKDIEISEKNITMKSYLDKIVSGFFMSYCLLGSLGECVGLLLCYRVLFMS